MDRQGKRIYGWAGLIIASLIVALLVEQGSFLWRRAQQQSAFAAATQRDAASSRLIVRMLAALDDVTARVAQPASTRVSPTRWSATWRPVWIRIGPFPPTGERMRLRKPMACSVERRSDVGSRPARESDPDLGAAPASAVTQALGPDVDLGDLTGKGIEELTVTLERPPVRLGLIFENGLLRAYGAEAITAPPATTTTPRRPTFTPQVRDTVLQIAPVAWLALMVLAVVRRRRIAFVRGCGRLALCVAGGASLVLLAAALPRDWASTVHLLANGRLVWFAIMVVASASLLMLVRRDRPDPTRCVRCDYNLTGNVSGICPECGTPVVAPESAAEPAAAMSER
jgi:hypothetical protein